MEIIFLSISALVAIFGVQFLISLMAGNQGNDPLANQIISQYQLGGVYNSMEKEANLLKRIQNLLFIVVALVGTTLIIYFKK